VVQTRPALCPPSAYQGSVRSRLAAFDSQGCTSFLNNVFAD
jgi:hypothetical protein